MKLPWLFSFCVWLHLASAKETSKSNNTRGILAARDDHSDVVPLDMDVFAKAVGKETPVTTVYRADQRSFEQVRENGGFWAKPAPDVPETYSIYSHVEGNIATSAYVSTTSVAGDRLAFYAENAMRNPTNLGKKSYIYKIQASKNFIDVNRSLRLPRYFFNAEHVAMHGFPCSQIQAYVESTPEILNLLRKSRAKEIEWLPNDKHSPLPADFLGSSTHAELAGFPENHAAWEKQPWKKMRQSNKGKVPDIKALYQVAKVHAFPESKLMVGEIQSPGTQGTYTPKLCARGGTECMPHAEPLTKTRLMAETRTNAKNTFARLMKRNEISGIALPNVLAKYQHSPLKLRLRGGLIRAGGAAVNALMLGSWIQDMETTFSEESTALERAAVSTALVPVVGCMMQGSLDSEHGRDKAVTSVDTSLCVLADVLTLFPPTLLYGLGLHLFRIVLPLFESGPVINLPPARVIYGEYKAAWALQHSKLENVLLCKEFRGNLTTRVMAERLDLITMGTQLETTVFAGSLLSVEGADGLDVMLEDGELDIENLIGGKESDENAQLARWRRDAIEDSQDVSERPDTQDAVDEILETTGNRRRKEPISQTPSEASSEPDGKPTISAISSRVEALVCEAAYRRAQRTFQDLGLRVATHLESSYKDFDTEFFENLRQGYVDLYYQRKSIAHKLWDSWTTHTIKKDGQRIIDSYIQEMSNLYRWGSTVGLYPGPGVGKVVTLLERVFTDTFKNDPCLGRVKNWARPVKSSEPFSSCVLDGYNCQWWGGMWDCEAPEVLLGEMEGNATLIGWTKDQEAGTACSRRVGEDDAFGGECCEAAGPKCMSGFRRLWCEIVPEVMVCAQDSLGAPCGNITTPPDECVTVPDGWNNKISSLRANKAAGECTYFL